MKRRSVLLVVAGAAAIYGCRRGATMTPSPAPARTPAPATTTPAPGTPTREPGAVAASRVRPKPSPDLLAKLRAVRVSEVLASIAGRENEPATQVFKNVTFLKNVTARQLVDTMETYGRALGWNCTNCHVVTDYSSDSRHDKGLAKTMQQMTAAINREWMPKINAQKPPTVTCMTCHRGYNIPTDSIDLRAWWPLGKPPA